MVLCTVHLNMRALAYARASAGFPIELSDRTYRLARNDPGEAMYCPQCGTESAPSLQYCRLCGANLKVIGKAVALSEAIGRSDRGPLPRLKEMVRNFKLEHVTDEISGALDRMNEEIARSSDEPRPRHTWWRHLREKKTPERRREDHRVKGTVSFFTGIGLSIFLYNLGAAVVLKLPPEVLAQIPFELNPGNSCAVDRGPDSYSGGRGTSLRQLLH